MRTRGGVGSGWGLAERGGGRGGGWARAGERKRGAEGGSGGGAEGAVGPAGCGAMRGGRRLFPLLLLALLPGLCHGRESAPGAVTCGSVLKLLNTRHSVRLHSHEVKYGSGEQGLAGELEHGGARAVRG